MEQPQAVASVLRNRGDFQEGRIELPELSFSQQELNDFRKVVLIGCGTSRHAAQVGRYLFEQLAGVPAAAEAASEFRYRDPLIDKNTLVIAIAQSGETADTVAAMQMVREKEGRVVTICNVEGSQSTRLAEGTLLAGYLGQSRGFLSQEGPRQLVDQLAQCPRLIGEILADTSGYQRLARRFSSYNNFLFLGRGINSPIALEGAIKLKEISYIHAEGYPAGEMKHGPIALIDEGMATLALAPNGSLYDKMVNNIQEVKARDGAVLAVATEGNQEIADQVDEVLYIPEISELLTPMLATIPLQLLAYHIAVLRGCDVDQPRNLAKSVTVE